MGVRVHSLLRRVCMKHCVSARRSLSLHIYLCISWETVHSMLHLLQRGIRVPMKSYLPCATNTFRKARAWPRWAAFYSSAPPESQVYCGKDDTPLVRTEYLSDKRIWILHHFAKSLHKCSRCYLVVHGITTILRQCVCKRDGVQLNVCISIQNALLYRRQALSCITLIIRCKSVT